MIGRIIKKAIREMKESKNRPIGYLMIAEVSLFFLFFFCLVLQYKGKNENANQLYIARWGILGAAVIVWGIYNWRETQWKKKR